MKGDMMGHTGQFWEKYLVVKLVTDMEGVVSEVRIQVSLGYNALEALKSLAQPIRTLANCVHKEYGAGKFTIYINEHNPKEVRTIINNKNNASQKCPNDEELTERVLDARDKVAEWLRKKIVDNI